MMPPYAKTIVRRAASKAFIAVAVCLLVLAGGCTDDARMPLYSRFVDFAGARWHGAESVEFDITPADTRHPIPADAEMSVYVRHGGAYPYAELWIVADMYADGVALESDTLRIPMSDADGNWLGCRSYGMYEVSASLPALAARADRIELWQAMPADEIESVRSVGVVARRKNSVSSPLSIF